MLLERFYFSEMILKVDGRKLVVARDANKKHRSELLKRMLDKNQDGLDAKEFFSEGFTDDDRCSLYFMIGHNINDTFRGSEFDTLFLDQTVGDQKDDTNHARFPREQGLVSLHSDLVNAVAMGRVLVGIAAGERKNDEMTLNQIDSNVNEIELRDLKLQCLAALTIGDGVAHAEIQSPDASSSKYGPPGEWNNNSCTVEYKLKSRTITTTDAEMRGSIDGYILGLHVSDLRNTNGEPMTLSRLIRMYYSKHGIKVDSTGRRIGFCERSNVIGSLNEENLKNVVVNVMKLYRHKLGSTGISDDSWQGDYSKYVSQTMAERPRKNICEQIHTTIDKKFPETPVDVFFVLDVTEQGTRGMQEQISVLGNLAGYLDIGYGAGSLTVLLNSRNEIGEVHQFLYNTTNSGCVACTLERLNKHEFRNLERDSVAGTLHMLNRTLTKYKEERIDEDGVPARVVIYFHYDTNINEEEDKLNDARIQLFYGHKDTQIFAIGTGEILEKIATDSNTVYTDLVFPVERAHRLKEEISKVPGILQYSECGNRRYRDEGNHVFHGYITPDEKQLWAMYPEFFLKSYSIEFKFKSENGKIKVCYDRGVTDPSTLDHNKFCKEIENPGSEVTFHMSNPCDKVTQKACLPFNFAIIGIPMDNSPGNQCTDHNCRRFDQIKFTVSHKGISCNGALGLLASPIAFFAVVYTALRNFL